MPLNPTSGPPPAGEAQPSSESTEASATRLPLVISVRRPGLSSSSLSETLSDGLGVPAWGSKNRLIGVPSQDRMKDAQDYPSR
jgi:hypothetical protein